MRDVLGSLALDGEDAISCLVACAFAEGHGGHGGAGEDDLVGFEGLGDGFGNPLGEGFVAFYVDCEEVGGLLLGDDTTGEIVSLGIGSGEFVGS